MGILTSDTFSPFIFVGLGGSGNKVVDRIAHKLHNHPDWKRIEGLVHFVGIDTNKHDLGRLEQIPARNHFLISSFDRSSYISRKRGEQELPADPMVTQWVPPDYKFRDGSTPGAGQIRIESRLSLHFNLEDDRAGMISRFNRILDEATKPDSPWRDDGDRVVNVMIYGSAAGGTGSGAFVMLAYLMRKLVEEHGWGRAKVVGNLMLPSLFYPLVEPVLHQDINANAYACLKEIEHLTRLDYGSEERSEPFHYDPRQRRPTTVNTRPFALLYLIDKPSELGIERHYDALADASFLQVFSPLLGSQEGEYDNYEKHQKQLALGYFSVHYGSYGAAVLHFPRRDLLAYARKRFVARAFDRFLNFGDDPRFAVDWEDKRFQRLAEVEQNKIVDEKFALWVAHKAELERAEDLKGVFTGIWSQENQRGETYRSVLRQRLFDIFDELDSLIDIESLDPVQVRESQTSLQRPLNQMRRDVSDSRGKVMEKLSSVSADIESGRFFGELFRGNEVNPLAQRYMLVKLAAEVWRTDAGREERRIGPFEDAEENSWLFESRENVSNLDHEATSESVKDAEKALAAASQRGMLAFGENKKFAAAKRQATELFDELADGNREWLKIQFWQRLHEVLQAEVDRRLGAFRSVARISDEQVRALKAEAEAFAHDPGSVDPNAQAAAYYLDLEVLRDDRSKKRLWEQFFRHRLDKPENFDDKAMFAVITSSFAPKQEEGRIRSKDAREIVGDIRAGLETEADVTFARALADMPDMHLAGALELEARYSLAGPDAIKDDVLNAVPEADVEKWMRDKIQRAADSAVVHANLDRSKFVGGNVRPNQSAFAGVHPRYMGDTNLALGKLISGADGSMEIIESWREEDSIVFYRAVLGVPLYFFSRVQGEYDADYRRVKADPHRSYPLHIESSWETLPNLDPQELQAADEQRRREDAARAALLQRHEGLWGFSLAGMLGTIARGDEGAYALSRGGRSKELAKRRCEAYDAFRALPDAFQADVVEEGHAALERAQAGRKEKDKVRAQLEAWEEKLAGLYNDAMFDEDDKEQQFLEEERALLAARLEAL
ncbi:MAG: hypothetical protein KDA24_25310 [Deltaproteobacteria bacterium]|nr:hypothetical protein [Deltaproteobacteria bacterium]